MRLGMAMRHHTSAKTAVSSLLLPALLVTHALLAGACKSHRETKASSFLSYDAREQILRVSTDVSLLKAQFAQFEKGQKKQLVVDFVLSSGWQTSSGSGKDVVLVGQHSQKPLKLSETYKVTAAIERNLLTFDLKDIASQDREFKAILQHAAQTYGAGDFSDKDRGADSYFARTTKQSQQPTVLSPEAQLNIEGVVLNGDALQYLLTHYDNSLTDYKISESDGDLLKEAMEKIVGRLVHVARNINEAERTK